MPPVPHPVIIECAQDSALDYVFNVYTLPDGVQLALIKSI